MTRVTLKTRRLTQAAATFSLAMLLSVSVSPQALAACSFNPGPAGTAGNDVVTCDDAHAGGVDLLGGDDKMTVNEGASLSGSVTTGIGNDLIVVNGGTITSNINLGNAVGSLGDIDRMFIFGGTFDDIELQSGAGTSPHILFMGGEMTGGSIEIRRGSTNTVIVFDGGRLSNEEGIEFQSGNASLAGPVDPTIYFRSGEIEAEELEFRASDVGGVNPANVTVIFDPVNSKDKAYFEALAAAAANGGDATLSTAALTEALANAPANPDDDHQMVVKAAEIEFGDGDDTLIFDGAVNTGDGPLNLVLKGGDEGEITGFEGGGGEDRLTVTGGSLLMLGEVEAFEHLAIAGGSTLTLTDDEYEIEESITVDGTSILKIAGAEVEIETEHFELQSGAGNGRLAGLPEHYATFATGGVLSIGALPGVGGGGDDDDDDDDDDVAPFAAADDDDDDDDDGPAVPGAAANVTINTGEATFVNGGTITTLNSVVGDTVTINGPYVAQSGHVALDAALGGSASATDRVVLNGAVAGTTTLYVNNVGGAGDLTGHGRRDGVEIVTSGADAFQADSFRLATNALSGREEVVAGPYAYTLAVTDDAALLQSDLLDQVPAYTTAPSVGQRLVAGGLDTLYKRLGEIRGGQNDGVTRADGLMWVRGHYSDVDVDAKQGFDFSQRSSGVLAGIGGTIATEGRTRLAVGAFGGYSTADASVDAVIFGGASSSSVDAEGWSFGGYATFYEAGRAGTGLYVDTVVKVDFMDFDMAARGRNAKGASEGDALTGSAEIGYGFALGGGLVVQPQAQIAYTDLTIEDFKDSYALAVSYTGSESLVGRLGLQVQGNWVPADGGFVSPYAIFNIYQEFEGKSRSDVDGVAFASDVSGTWYSVGGGIDAQLASNVSLYGAGEYHFGDIEGWQGTGGVKLNW